MSVRELWDTVVLRDVLGYTLPGLVTLSALALPCLTRLGLNWSWSWWQALEIWKTFRWPIVAALLPLGFLVGHVQAQVIGCFEKYVPGWVLGKLTLRYLCCTDHKMGHAYLEAAFELFDTEGKLREHLTTRKLLEGLARRERNTEAWAEVLWRLCDYHVLGRDPNSHATYMGRYYVLAVLFSNLGLSAIFLATCTSIAMSPINLPGKVIIAGTLLFAFVYFLVVRFVLWPYNPTPQCSRTRKEDILRFTDTMLIGATLGAPLLCYWLGEQALPGVLLLVGLALIYWSGRFRREFVERTFPIFYALRESSIGSTSERPTLGWRAWLCAGIGAAAFGYWLRGRG